MFGKPLSPMHWWRSRGAAKVRLIDRYLLQVLLVSGILALLNLANWWFKAEHVAHLGLFLALSAVLWWLWLRSLVQWINYAGIAYPEKPIDKPKLSVAIFTTSSPGEPLSMFAQTLEACRQISYPHTTYLLDDTEDPAFEALAQEKGAKILKLVGLPGAKAGKVNAALKMIEEELVFILDPDHIPFPQIFDELLPFFRDAKLGFVQIAQAYYNQDRSFTAAGAAEQTYHFYGPTQMGLFSKGAAVAIGANCLFRREALLSIGGHGIGLAEDLVTSIRLHAKGWKSIYYPKVLSRGLVPEDFDSFCRQQLKWSRGVHEVLFEELPKAWSGLNWWQRLSYFTIGTYYLSGLSTLLLLLLPYIFLWTGLAPARMNFVDFLLHWLPLALVQLSFYFYSQRWMADAKVERGTQWRGMVLKFATWPVFVLGLWKSLFNRHLAYIPTAKKAQAGFSPFIRPVLAMQSVYLISLVGLFIQRSFFTPEADLMQSSAFSWGMLAFASIAFIIGLWAHFAAYESTHLKAEEPWQRYQEFKEHES